MVCSAPRVVSTVRRSRSPVEADEPQHAVLALLQVDEDDPPAGPDRKLIRRACMSWRAPGPSPRSRSPRSDPGPRDHPGLARRPRRTCAGAGGRLANGARPKRTGVSVARHRDGVVRDGSSLISEELRPPRSAHRGSWPPPPSRRPQLEQSLDRLRRSRSTPAVHDSGRI